MKKESFTYIVLGIIIGAIFSLFLIPVTGDTLVAPAIGGLGGLFLGWFVAAIVKEAGEKKKNTSDLDQ